MKHPNSLLPLIDQHFYERDDAEGFLRALREKGDLKYVEAFICSPDGWHIFVHQLLLLPISEGDRTNTKGELIGCWHVLNRAQIDYLEDNGVFQLSADGEE